MASKERIGFIGLGNMGAPMARRLVDAGYELVVTDAVPEAVDLSRETAATRKLYGLDHPVTGPYGLRCLMARRLVEKGVRFAIREGGHTVGAGVVTEVIA